MSKIHLAIHTKNKTAYPAKQLIYRSGLLAIPLALAALLIWLTISNVSAQGSLTVSGEPEAPRSTPAGSTIGQFDIVGPAGSGKFGRELVALPNGNFVIIDPEFDDGTTADVGAVYLYDGSTFALISTLKGNNAGDRVGSLGFTLLTNGNILVFSPLWDNGAVTDAGAVTFINSSTGLEGVVSPSNSLVGSSPDDQVGANKATALPNGNYVVSSPLWDNNGVANVGAATWGNGLTGITGTVTISNSLHGKSAEDRVSSTDLTLTGFTSNGVRVNNYPSGTDISLENYFIANSNYVVVSKWWDNGAATDAGAATWADGSTGITGSVSVTNSHVGSSSSDAVGFGIWVLANGNYILRTPTWDNGATANVGAVTWVNGTTGNDHAGGRGPVSPANSLIGSHAEDAIGTGGTEALTNGNYVVYGNKWNDCRGHATWGDGSAGTVGVVSEANSLVGTTPDPGIITCDNNNNSGDQVGERVIFLNNGNYAVGSSHWNNGTAGDFLGAVTWGNGTTGTSGEISATNSLIGTSVGDRVGAQIIALRQNGNYVVVSNNWDNGSLQDVGAVTWGNGATGTTGVVSTANSLYGTTAGDRVGSGEVGWLFNGNYVVASPNWDNGAVVNAGSVTWVNGITGLTSSGTFGPVTIANSLYGTTAEDQVGKLGLGQNNLEQLTTSNFVVCSPNWDNGMIVDAGAATWGNGALGITGPVSTTNSLYGTHAGDMIAYGLPPYAFCVQGLSDGNYIVGGMLWNEARGALTWGNGTTGTTGAVSITNSLVGTAQNELSGGWNNFILTGGSYIVNTESYAGNHQGAAAWSTRTPGLSGQWVQPYVVAESHPGTGLGIRAGYQTFSELFNVLAVGRYEDNIVTMMYTAWPITVTFIGNGSGMISATPVQDFWPSGTITTTKTINARIGKTVTLTATADANSIFTGWAGACTGSGSCILTVDAAKNVTATFALQSYPVTVTRDGSGSGLVASTPPGISCGDDCSETFDYGTVVTLTATADAGSIFTGWKGACTGSGDCVLTVDAAKNVTATFSLQSYLVTVTRDGNGSGLVASTPPGINCGDDCSDTFDYGTVVTLTATADSDSIFTGWAGACTGSGSCILTVDAAKNVTSTFILKEPNYIFLPIIIKDGNPSR